LNLMFFKVRVLRRATSSSEIVISYILNLNYAVDDDQMQNVFICVTCLLCCRLYRAAVIGLYVDCHFITFTLFILSKSFHDAVFLL
jgi:hypothetical protein